MARSKYINTFNTTADYENYIESALPEFPNVGYDKQAGKVKIVRTSPNSHLIYCDSVETPNLNTNPLIRFNDNSSYDNAFQYEQLTNTYYIDSFTNLPATITIFSFVYNGSTNSPENILNINKINIDASNVTNFLGMGSLTNLKKCNFTGLQFTSMTDMAQYSDFANAHFEELIIDGCFNNLTKASYMFTGCNKMKVLHMHDCDLSNITEQYSMFYYCNALTDVYINVEGTLMKITNNLSSQGNNYVPSSATIHYDNGSEVIDYKWQNNAWTPQS